MADKTPGEPTVDKFAARREVAQVIFNRNLSILDVWTIAVELQLNVILNLAEHDLLTPERIAVLLGESEAINRIARSANPRIAAEALGFRMSDAMVLKRKASGS